MPPSKRRTTMWDKYDDAVTLFNKLYELFENDKIVQADFTNWGDISSDPYFIFEGYRKNMRLIVEHMSYHRIRITFRTSYKGMEVETEGLFAISQITIGDNAIWTTGGEFYLATNRGE